MPLAQQFESLWGFSSSPPNVFAFLEQHQVAIKVPTEERFRKPEDADEYLKEARTVASLNHPGIVPVYDMETNSLDGASKASD